MTNLIRSDGTIFCC